MLTTRLTAAMVVILAAMAARGDNWPAWRGPDGTGYCREKGLPLRWSPTENIRWKIPLPAPGNSTPVVWGDRIFLTQANEQGTKRSLWCLDRRDGKLLWEQTVEYGDREPTHNTNPYCSASPATDGQRVVASFGSAGLFCYGVDGKELWRRELGKCLHIWGNAASPVLHDNLALLNFGPGERTFLLAVDKNTGRDVWKAEEPDGKLGNKGSAEWIGSWSTPAVVAVAGREELIMTWPNAVKSYDPHTGNLLWTSTGLSRLVYTSPLVSPEVVVAMSGFSGPYLAVRPGGADDVTATHRLWCQRPAPQRIGSGVIVGSHVYMVNATGTFQCIDVKTGDSLCNERVGGGAWGSLVYADGRLYVANLDGETVVLAPKPALEVLSRNPLKERMLASIAISDGAIFLRTYKHLWCIQSAAAGQPANRAP